MQVVRKDHDSLDRERPLAPRDAKSRAQCVHVVNQNRGCPIRERDREEVGAAWDVVAPVSNHPLILSRITLRSIRATHYGGDVSSKPVARMK
jgi:hypothetical protein